MNGMAELIREELRKGCYQMPGDTLPYETKAASIAAALSAAGFGDVREAKAQALRAAADAVSLRIDQIEAHQVPESEYGTLLAQREEAVSIYRDLLAAINATEGS